MGLNYKIIGNRIQARRRSKGVTQEEMAEALDLSTGFVSQVERGVTKISLDSLYKITRYLGCRVSDIVDDDNKEKNAYCQVDFDTMYELLPPQDQRLFYYMLEVYARNRDIIK